MSKYFDESGGFQSNRGKKSKNKFREQNQQGERADQNNEKKSKQPKLKGEIPAKEFIERVLDLIPNQPVSSTSIHTKGSVSSPDMNDLVMLSKKDLSLAAFHREANEARSVMEDIERILAEQSKDVSDDKKFFFDAYKADLIEDGKRFFSEGNISGLKTILQKVQSINLSQYKNMQESPFQIPSRDVDVQSSLKPRKRTHSKKENKQKEITESTRNIDDLRKEHEARLDALRTEEEGEQTAFDVEDKDVLTSEESQAEHIERDVKNYDELFIRDQWVKQNADGTLSHLVIENIFYQDVLYVDIQIEGQMGSFPIDTLREKLRQEGYVLNTPGMVSERSVPQIQQEVPSDNGDLVLPNQEKIPLQEASESIKNAPSSETEPSISNIDLLRNEVNLARTKWVETDVKNTTAWKKFKSLFGIEKGVEKDDAQIAYELALNNLCNAEIQALQRDTVQNKGFLSPEEKEMKIAKLLRYYKLDESTNLINERTQYKAEHQTFSEKIVDSLGALGRAYNRIPLKQKLLLTGALAGITIGTTLSGGTAIGAMASVMMLRKIASGAGTAVGVEALLENIGSKRESAKAEEAINAQIETLKTEGQALNKLSEFLENDISKLNEKLQNEKRAKTLRKVSALGVGGLVGSGFLTQMAMDHFGGNESVDAIRNYVNEHTSSQISPISSTPAFVSVDNANVPPIADTLKPDEVSDFIHQDYVVQKGDSVWKIAGGLADKMGLQGSERDYFIDTLKDQYGDVQLKAGETINFSSHGIDKDFVDNAFGHAKAISPDHIASIASNDAKIADFARTHPNVTLTNEIVDNILKGNETVVHNNSVLSQMTTSSSPDISNTVSQSVSESVATAPVETSLETPFDVSLQSRVDDWYMQIFRTENPALGQDFIIDKSQIGQVKIMDMIKDARLYKEGSLSGYVTGMNGEQLKNFADFSQNIDKYATGFDKKTFFYTHPDATVMDYLKKVAPFIPKGQRLGLFTTSN